MKTNRIIIAALLASGFAGYAQDYSTQSVQGNNASQNAEVPGDNFSLEGALELFKRSASPEEFEKLLNSPDSKVNNLDLNNDNNIDYIRVIDRNEGNVHAFVLQDVISSTESQDVAVIELQKLDNGKATLQIIGDADIYGIETIIEPSEEVRVNAGTSTARNVTNVWMWPAVQYVYAPYYTPWISPWSWAYYPGWWTPWSPVAFYIYSPWWTPYRPYYSFCYSHRIGYWPRLYAPYRCSSNYVSNRCYTQINNYRSTYGYSRSGHGNGNGYNGYSNNGNGHNHRGYADRTMTDYRHAGGSYGNGNNGGNGHHGWYSNGNGNGNNSNPRTYGGGHFSGSGNNDNNNGHRGYQGYQGYQGYSGRHLPSSSSMSDGNRSTRSWGGGGNTHNFSQGFSRNGAHMSSGFSGGASHFGGGGRSGGFSGGGFSGGGSRSGGFSGGGHMGGGGGHMGGGGGHSHGGRH